MSGRVGDLSPQQERALAELKNNVADVHKADYDDYYYLRWLRARDFNVKKAEQMMRKNIQWRERIGADTLLTDYTPPEVLDKYYPRGYLGPGKDGCPVRLMPFKNLDLRGCVMSVSRSEVVKFITYVFEQDIAEMKKETQKRGTVVEMHTYILDMDGYTFAQASNRQAVDMLNDLLKVYEANYPERLKQAIFINAPSYFPLIMALSRPFLTDVTYNKFKFFGKTGFQETLLDIIDADLLPASLGGNRRDPDGNPLCTTVVNYGDFIPKSYYFNKDFSNFHEEEGVKTINLSTRSSHLVEVQVDEPGTRLEWEVITLNNDLAVGLFYMESKKTIETNEEDMKEILPVEKVNCHIIPESTAYMCNKPGIYVVKFDNSYSWFTSKKVHYRIRLVPPIENIIEEFTRL